MSKNEPSYWKIILFSTTTIIFLTTASCNVSKKLTSKDIALTPKPADVVLNQLNSKKLSPEWFYAKAKITFNDNGNELSANSTIIIEKDSLIWLSIRKLGFEAARALVTKDSFYVLNRLESSYSAQSINILDAELNLPKTESSFQVLQNIVLGNPLILSDKNMNCTMKNDSLYLLDNQVEGVNCHYEIEGKKTQLKSTQFEDKQQQRNLQIHSENYATLDKKFSFAHHRNLQSLSPELGNVSLDIVFSEVELNVVKSIKFDVPAQYKRVKL